MNCANHPELPAAAFCRECGKPMCQECQRPALGSIYCVEHLPAPAAPEPPRPEQRNYANDRYTAPSASPYTSAAPPPPTAYDAGAHPALALILGFIPGVGAIYNGQYAKGLIHAVVFGLLISITSSSHSGALAPLFALLIAAWVFYMAFEAYHTARKRRYGVQVEEFSSLFDVRPTQGRFPAGALILIGLGFLLLLDTTDIISMYQMERYWPVGLIVFGIYMLWSRLTARAPEGGADPNAEVRR
jgi:TM2 domain-containing membrane protein YozV